MVLLWGVPSDAPLRAVEEILMRERVPYAFLDQRAILNTELVLSVGEKVAGVLRVSGDCLQLDEVRAVYARPYDLKLLKPLSEAGEDSPEFRHAAMLTQALSIWLDLTPALVLNRPREMALNYSKPYQAAIIERAGFAVPETVLTTDPDVVYNFRRQFSGVIYKSVSSLRSIVTQIRPEDEARITDVTWCPTQFQRRISGPEIRAHVIGSEVFASEILSAADDYRYATLSGDSVKIQAYDLPADCVERCRVVAAAMNFVIAGIDLRLENGTWFCFEANPSPAFMYYQEHTRQPIDEAVARLLQQAC